MVAVRGLVGGSSTVLCNRAEARIFGGWGDEYSNDRSGVLGLAVRGLDGRRRDAGQSEAKLTGGVKMAATVPVVVAAADIPRGKMVTAKDLALREWPKELSSAGNAVRKSRRRWTGPPSASWSKGNRSWKRSWAQERGDGAGRVDPQGDAGLHDSNLARRGERRRIHSAGQQGRCAVEPQGHRPGRGSDRRRQHDDAAASRRGAGGGPDAWNRPKRTRSTRTSRVR